MIEHADADRIARRLAEVARFVQPFLGTVYRFADPAFASKHELLTGEGARKFGGRWNSRGSFASVYVALTEETALAESKANHHFYGWDAADRLPRLLVAVDVDLSRVLDLTEGAVRKAIVVSSTRMRSDDWRGAARRGEESLTQSIGRLAYTAAIEALIVPACDGGRNLVWFPGNLLRTSTIQIRRSDALPS